jgi:polyisoprenoid-binding protein YceI
MIELGPSNARLTVHTTRAGMAARAGHDLVIEPERWSATLDIDADPATLTAQIDAASLVVREGTGGVKALTDSDRTDIQKNINGKVLNTASHPQIMFESTGFDRSDPRLWQIDGRLTLVATTMPIRVSVVVAPTASDAMLRASVEITQTSFGIKPFSALMGSLKVADAVEIRVETKIDLPS